VPHVRRYFPTVADVCGDRGVARIIDEALGAAFARGFRGRASARSYLDVTLLLGAGFDIDPLVGFAAPHLDWDRARAALQRARAQDQAGPVGIVAEDDEPDPIDMLEALHHQTWGWLDRTAGENFRNLYRALVRLRRIVERGPQGAPADVRELGALCAEVFPEKAAAVDRQSAAAFLNLACERAARDGFESGYGRAIYVLHCFVGGVAAFRDPAYAIDGARLGDIGGEGEARAGQYAAFVSDYIAAILTSARNHAPGAV
jgi:hypothetical protein